MKWSTLANIINARPGASWTWHMDQITNIDAAIAEIQHHAKNGDPVAEGIITAIVKHRMTE